MFISFDGSDDQEPQTGGEGEAVAMLSFPCMDEATRPPAPPVADFPAGCEVELIDYYRGKEAQTAEFWDYAVELLYSTVRQTRQEVTVVRHSGDYSYVTLEINPELKVGCHLYRACLREPKVRFRRYADMATEPEPAAASHTSNQLVNPQLLTSPDEKSKKLFDKTISRGNKAFQAKEYTTAIEYYTTAHSLQVSLSEKLRALANRSAAHLALRDFPSALEDALACVLYDPKDVAGYCRTGNVYRVIRQFDRAEEMYSAALKLQPRNEQIRMLQISNAASAHFRSKTSKMFDTKKIPIEVNMPAVDQFVVTCRDPVYQSAVIFSEKPVYAIGIPVGGQATARGDSFWCANCLKSLVKKETVLAHLQSEQAKAFASGKYPAVGELFPCSKGCSQMYCSAACRDEAWTAHHCVECTRGGRWAEGMERLESWLRHSPLPLQSRANILLTVRILAVCSALPRDGPNGKPLKDSANELLRFFSRCPPDSGMESAVLTPCFEALCNAFSRDEARALNFVLFCRCFYIVKRCGVIFCASSWSTFKENADTNLEALKSGISSADPALMQGLEEIIKTSIPGVHNRAVGLFEILSLCQKPTAGVRPTTLTATGVGQQQVVSASPLSPDSNMDEAEGPNAKLRPTPDIKHGVHVVASSPISKGGHIVIDCLMLTM